MARMNGKVALITGAGSMNGLGGATAMRFAEEGATVWLTDLRSDGIEAVATAIEARNGHARTMVQDVTKEDGWDELIDAMVERDGGIDALVNNAGIAVLRPIEAFATDDWHRQLRVNLDSVFFGSRRAIARMREQGRGGAIINISSVAGIVGVPYCSAYAAAKGGVRIMSKVLAVECARDGIRVNTVHPGMIETDMQIVARRDNPDNFDKVVGSIPMGRMGEPLDIANANLFLASDEGRYVTGTEIIVDGGMTAQ
ncbi:SDR family NAD(P)-dependent oxidoreductase [Croceicoccus sp. F390]|uniref:SDR family NAD(P)-dependent oxidoreductase n=1 Tax=Croceicoccus esteveae TaxID=3075597 RepID=A0ABU2ZH97_9SPHN|nr:SDR family NAD(P)-dependent oxidoreductase [Croceicoccus sp. F390]MDT0575980.1 SDR family NAD(P)-dependent oxidoreductase [Croceicoccus sp. F390]